MTRLVWLAFLCFGASTSRAEGMLPGGAEINFAELLIHEDKTSAAFAQPSTDEARDRYFNMAHCVCSQLDYDGSTLPEFYAGHYGYKLTVTGGDGTVIDRPIEIWTGASCNVDQQTRMTNCHDTMISAGTVSQIQTAGETIIEIPMYDLMVPTMRMGCVEQDAQMGTTWALVDSEGDGTLDYSASATVTTDTKAPPLPTNFRAVGAENAIKLEWDPPEGSADIAYYQALCATTLGGSPAKSGDLPDPRYLTERQLCNASADAFLVPSDISSNTGTDAGTGSIVLTEDMAQLNPSYICGESTATAREMRITGLKNGVEYTVILLSIDKAGNARGTYFTSSLVPVPATDFWEDLQDQGSGVEGGFCLIAQAYGDGNPLTQTLRSFRDHTLADSVFGRWLVDVYYGTVGSLDLHGSLALRIVVGIVLLPFVVLALLWHALTLPGLLALVVFGVLARRRVLRARRFALAATMLAVFVLAPTRADAQVPYWEEDEFGKQQELAYDDPMRVTWHAGVRLGPYVPGIDAQIDMPVGKYDGPYEQMFGGYSILPVLDVERFFLHYPGQLGVAFSIGYMGKKARAWQAGSDPSDPNRPRAEGDENKFRMIPMALSGVFRLTYFDDNFGVPLVPYARAGLAYYVWWITAPNGDFAKACTDGGMTSGCMQTKARGASLGFVGSLGLSIRAERIDESAARSMRESGIEHAGFYAEYSLGKVDGFGSDTKLSVGDATWFAGVDFEF